MIDATGTAFGLIVQVGSGAEVADLAIRDAGRTGLLVRGASDVAVRRVHASGRITEINLERVTRGRVENSIESRNRCEIVASGGGDVAVVNCTLVDNESLGPSLPSASKTVAFNNAILDVSVGIYPGEGAGDARLDHNLYSTQFVGKQAGQIGRKSIGDGLSLTGQDGRSVRLPLGFRDAAGGDFNPVGTFDRDIGRATSADWGAGEFAGIKAPDRDIEGKERSGRFDVGAYETDRPDPRLVRDPGRHTGIKSAGVFSTDGRLLAYLFHNLPLAKGESSYRLPSRDFQNRPTAPGKHKVRAFESDLRWDYIGPVGDTGTRPVGLRRIGRAGDTSGVVRGRGEPPGYDPTTYRGSVKSLFPMKPGQTFRLGFLINDNDEPGSDIQHYLVWPATYSNFGPVEDGALAVLE